VLAHWFCPSRPAADWPVDTGRSPAPLSLPLQALHKEHTTAAGIRYEGPGLVHSHLRLAIVCSTIAQPGALRCLGAPSDRSRRRVPSRQVGSPHRRRSYPKDSTDCKRGPGISAPTLRQSRHRPRLPQRDTGPAPNVTAYWPVQLQGTTLDLARAIRRQPARGLPSPQAGSPRSHRPAAIQAHPTETALVLFQGGCFARARTTWDRGHPRRPHAGTGWKPAVRGCHWNAGPLIWL
jgi:hypothetical protein